MAERSAASIKANIPSGSPGSFCSNLYDLHGPQVEPESSHWLETCDLVNGCPVPRPVTLPELINKLPGNTFTPYPTDPAILQGELQELIMLGRLRDEPGMIAHDPVDPTALANGQCVRSPITEEPLQLRLPLSMFLELRPQPLGAVINTARDGAFPVINSGRELARYFENEPPALQFRMALNYMIREQAWSPPRQAWIWAALDIAIYSALAAAWHIKWRGGTGVQFRPRPWECHHKLDVLFDRVPNSTNSADGARRSFPPGAMPLPGGPPLQSGPPVPGTPLVPESAMHDINGITGLAPSQPTPGTPRHPAYPSGHSTYSAAAARLLIEFFPMYREQLCRLADNTGLARLWAGVHWRSDHTFGQQVGTAVAESIIDQLRATGIPRFPAPRPGDEAPPNPPVKACDPTKNWLYCPPPQLPPCTFNEM